MSLDLFIKIIAQALHGFNRKTSAQERASRKTVLASFKTEEPKQTWVRANVGKRQETIPVQCQKVPSKKGRTT